MGRAIRLYIDSKHPIGGVTTWAFQVSKNFVNLGDIKVIAVHTVPAQSSDGSLFPGPALHVSAGLKGVSSEVVPMGEPSTPTGYEPRKQRPSEPEIRLGTNNTTPAPQAFPRGDSSDTFHVAIAPSKLGRLHKPTLPCLPTHPTVPTQPTRAILPTKPSAPTKPTLTTKRTLPTKPTKVTLPTKPILPDLARLPRSWEELDDTARIEVEGTELFVPNYVEAGYRHAAISRVRNLNSKCLGYCHTDERHYYALLKHYEPIIQSFIAVSRRCREQLAAVLPHRKDDIQIVPYGVSVPDEPRAIAHGECLRLLYSGRLVKRQKRILDFAALITQLEDRGVNYALDFVGTGPDQSELLDAVRVYSRVRLLGAVPSTGMSTIYPQYDVLVLTSESEGLSIAMLEAMSYGVVPVVTRVSGAEDAVVDGENGFLCDVGDLCSMADRIEYLAAEKARLTMMSKEAFKKVRSEYNIEIHFQMLTRAITDVMKKPLASPAAAASCLRGGLR
jgi:glycosyltransferase involved in cell wall biosynthesis